MIVTAPVCSLFDFDDSLRSSFMGYLTTFLHLLNYVPSRFEFSKTVTVKIVVFWYVTPCSLVDTYEGCRVTSTNVVRVYESMIIEVAEFF
jgi:hypothetical protein